MGGALTVATFRLSLVADTELRLPRYAGSTFRGGFGMAFKHLVCVNPTRICEGCPVRMQCAYTYVFETPPTVDESIFSRYPAVPHPFVIVPPGDGRREGRYRPGDAFTLDLTLIGHGLSYLPYFLYTFDRLGRQGVGPGRGRYRLASASAVNGRDEAILVYDGGTKQMTDDYPVARWTPEPAADAVARVALTFETPVRIVQRGDLVVELTFQTLFRTLLRRISALCAFHGEAALDVDFRGLVDRAGTVRTAASDLRWYDWTRYSNRQQQRMQLGGLIGSIAFEGDLTPFMPYLRLGERVHVGKGTSFGLGRYGME